jgi:UDP-GlcNAc:undecaprenyl-phosphate GlcNAc-1-phosphate transferase
MSYLVPILTPFGLGCVAALILTPVLRLVAPSLGFVDQPKADRQHRDPTPLLGGVAIAAGVALGLGVRLPLEGPVIGVLAGAGLLVAFGLVDDRRAISPRAKLLVQILAAGIAVSFGIRTTFLPFEALNTAFTLFWIVGITNAFNLLDNMNGLAAGVAAIAGATFAILASRYQQLGPEQLPAAVMGAALAGACLGFLPFNFPRGRIFMGDAGSLVVGFVLASVAAIGSWKSPTLPTSIGIPVLVLAYPIFDTTLVTLLRWRDGRPITEGGKDHSSHRLVRLGLGETEAVLLIYLFSLCHAFTVMLVASVTFRLSLIALGTSASVLFIFGMVLRKAGAVPARRAPEPSAR